MNPRFLMRAGAVATALSIGAVLAPPAAPAVADTATGCEVTGGTLAWGVKESFRAYISGTIANGSWETSGGAEYDTPQFRWSGATGSFDPETGVGAASFVGTVHFTGHDGVLDLTLANPTIEFDGQGDAALLLDARSNDMEGEIAVDAEQEWVGDIGADPDLPPGGGELVIDDAPVTLTNSGAGAFAGFYEAGADLDPLALTLELGACDAAAPAASVDDGVQAEADQPQAQSLATAPSDVPWFPIGVGGAALLIIGLTAGLLIGGRLPRSGVGARDASGGEQSGDAP